MGNTKIEIVIIKRRDVLAIIITIDKRAEPTGPADLRGPPV